MLSKGAGGMGYSGQLNQHRRDHKPPVRPSVVDASSLVVVAATQVMAGQDKEAASLWWRSGRCEQVLLCTL